MIAKTTITIMADEKLMERVQTHARKNGENLTEFYTRAIINQLEKDGDFEARDLVKEETDNG
nr:MAG TPA: repressor [Caudoviricetes sp.]